MVMSGKQIEKMDKWTTNFARLLSLVVVVLLLALVVARVTGSEESSAPKWELNDSQVDINLPDSTTFP